MPRYVLAITQVQWRSLKAIVEDKLNEWEETAADEPQDVSAWEACAEYREIFQAMEKATDKES